MTGGLGGKDGEDWAEPTGGNTDADSMEPGSSDDTHYEPHRSRVGEVLEGKWRLVERLGGGGMSDVYRAEHVSLGRTVAIKVLLPELATSALFAQRVLREGRAANLVDHPNVVRVEDIGLDSHDAPYLVMEFLAGVDLAEYAASERGVLAPEKLMALMLPVLDALGALHDAGIIHRDLKPANVFLVREGDGWSPRLLDFGLASLTGALEIPRITASDVTLGTPAYMSPEQIRDPRNLTPRSDLWSVGVMLYELLSGVLPFRADNIGTFVIAISTELPVPLRRRVPTLGSSLCAVIMQCLEKEPRHRPANVRTLLSALSTARYTTEPPKPDAERERTTDEPALPASPLQPAEASAPVVTLPPPPASSTPIVAVPAPSAPTRWRWWVAAFVLVALAGVVWALRPPPAQAPPTVIDD